MKAQSSGAVEYTDCISVEAKTTSLTNECPGYTTQPSDDSASVLQL